MWHVRFYVDVQGSEKRQRKSVPIGSCVGNDKLTKPEAARKGSELIASLGVNTEEHLKTATSTDVITFRHQVDWCQQNRRAWTQGRPGPISTMESQLRKHILPRLGDLPLSAITEKRVQEFIAELQKATFERRKPKGKDRKLVGDVVGTYKLSSKTISNIVGVVKLVVGKKVWIGWDLDLGKRQKPKQRYFSEQQMRAIVGCAEGQYKVLFALLAATGIRIGEACGLQVGDVDFANQVIYVNRSFSEIAGRMLPPKSDNAVRQIDIDSSLCEILRFYFGGRTSGLVFRARNGSPLRAGNIIKRVLNPILDKLGIPKGGKVNHAFRHGRVTMLRKMGAPGDLQKQWIGHSSLRTTDVYSHTDEELEYRRINAGVFSFKVDVGPNGPKMEVGNFSATA